MDVVSLLEKSKFFSSITPAHRKAVASICIPKSLRKREIVFHEGGKGHSMYLLAQGTVQLFKTSAEGREVVIKLLKPGEIFAEAVLFEKDTYPVSAMALTPAEIFLIPKRQFHCLLEDGAFRADFISMLLSKQRYLAERIFRLSALDVEQRFFHFLRDHFGELEEYDIDLAKSDVAAAIDALPETLSRMLLRLRDEGKLAWDGRKLALRPGFWDERSL